MATKDPPSKAARLYAATLAALDDGGPAFGVRVVKPGQPELLDRATAAYRDPSAYPLPNPRNWLSQLQNVDPKTLPKTAFNVLKSLAVSTAQDPVSALVPLPKISAVVKAAKASRAVKATRVGRLKEYARTADMVTEHGQRTKDASKYFSPSTGPVPGGRLSDADRATTQRALALYEASEAARDVALKLPAGVPARRNAADFSRQYAKAMHAEIDKLHPEKGAPGYRFTRQGPRR